MAVYSKYGRKEITTSLTGNFDFKLQKLYYCLESAVSKDSRLMQAIGDRGSLAILGTVIAKSGLGGGWVTLAEIDAAIVPRRIATSRRIRALVEWLEHCGGLERTRPDIDLRRRPFRVSGWLVRALGDLTSASFAAMGASASPELPGLDLQGAVAFLARRILPCVLDAAVLPPEVVALTELRGGYLLMLRLLCEARGRAGGARVEFSRKRFARTFHVSRAHVTGLIARAERYGWLKRLDGEAIRIENHVYAAWCAFFDDQLTMLGRIAAEFEDASGDA